MYHNELIDTPLSDGASSANQLGTSVLVREGAVRERGEFALEGSAQEVGLSGG